MLEFAPDEFHGRSSKIRPDGRPGWVTKVDISPLPQRLGVLCGFISRKGAKAQRECRRIAKDRGSFRSSRVGCRLPRTWHQPTSAIGRCVHLYYRSPGGDSSGDFWPGRETGDGYR
jgi:hypothetical protein